MEFSRQEYWRGLYSLLQGSFLTQGSNLGLPHGEQLLHHLSRLAISKSSSNFSAACGAVTTPSPFASLCFQETTPISIFPHRTGGLSLSVAGSASFARLELSLQPSFLVTLISSALSSLHLNLPKLHAQLTGRTDFYFSL